MKGGQALVRLLRQAGVEIVFGLCGDTSLPFYEALLEAGPSPRHVLTRDERSAGYMADAYARLSGRVGVCEGPSGGGATYLAPGLIEANLSSSPLLALTTDIDQRLRGRGTLTEMDQAGFFGGLTTWSRVLTSATELPWALGQALRLATSGRLGAVHLGLPYPVQEEEVQDDAVRLDPRLGRYPASRTSPEPTAAKRAARLLAESRRPVIVAGAGVLRAEAWAELQTLAELLGCPVATSISGKGALAEVHPLALGVIGSNGGLPYRHRFLKAADLILYVGCRTGSVTTEKWSLPVDRTVKIIQLDVEPSHLGLNYDLAEGLAGDAKLGLAALVEEVARLCAGRSLGKVDPAELAQARAEFLAERLEFASDDVPLWPERFVAELGRVLPQPAVVVADPGTATPYLSAYWPVPQAGRWFLAPRAHGALGYALAAVVGAHLAKPEVKAVALMGDGGFAMSAGELETFVRLNLPVTLVVLRNAVFGWVKAGQRLRGEKYFGVDFSATDHVRVAQAYGFQAWRVERPSELLPALSQAFAHPGPSLVEVLVQPLHLTRAPVSKWVA